MFRKALGLLLLVFCVQYAYQKLPLGSFEHQVTISVSDRLQTFALMTCYRERERERARARERERERERDTDRQTETYKDRDRETETERMQFELASTYHRWSQKLLLVYTDG